MATGQSGLGWAGKRRDGGKRSIDRLVPSRADCTAKPVEQRALGLVSYRMRNVRIIRSDDMASEDACRFRFRIHLVLSILAERFIKIGAQPGFRSDRSNKMWSDLDSIGPVRGGDRAG